MKKIGMKYFSKIIGVTFLVMGIQPAARALELGDDLAIHGYGHQGFMQSKDNNYLSSGGDGTWNNNLMALVLTATVDDSTRVWTQLHNTSAGSRLDWAFVDHQFSNTLSGRMGQIKFPFGLYNEIIDAHFLQQSTLPPSLYQETTKMRFESFRGVSFNYIVGGGLALDIYGGEAMDNDQAGVSVFGRMVGGRAIYNTPVEGLRLMVSSFRSNVTNIATTTHFNGATIAADAKSFKQTTALSVSYVQGNWDIKSEAARSKYYDVDSSTWYIQAGYAVADKWTPFVRYDYINTDESKSSDPSYYQQTSTVGLTYKLNNNVSLRMEDHFVKGYALPAKSYSAAVPGSKAATGVVAGTGTETWNIFVASINFIF